VPERVSGGLRFGRQAARVMLSRAGAVPSQYPGRACAGTRATTSAQARYDWRAGLARAHFIPGRAVPVTGQFSAVPRVAQSARSGWTCIHEPYLGALCFNKKSSMSSGGDSPRERTCKHTRS
jgi:hypothetical protein